jgi:hypothetical protein
LKRKLKNEKVRATDIRKMETARNFKKQINETKRKRNKRKKNERTEKKKQLTVNDTILTSEITRRRTIYVRMTINIRREETMWYSAHRIMGGHVLFNKTALLSNQTEPQSRH